MKTSTRDVWMLLTYVILLIASATLLVAGIVRLNAGEGAELLAAGALGLIVVGAVVPLALQQAADRQVGAGGAAKVLAEQSELLRKIHEHTLLSDSAKRIAYRREELELLRRAIEEDLARQEWQAARVLVDAMAREFGYREEAEEFRQRIEDARSGVESRKLEEALSRFRTALAAHDWAAAHAEAARLQRLYPERMEVGRLEAEIKDAWERHKHAVEQEFLDAAGRGDVEAAMALLKTIDQYLTPAEAEPYREVARGVIGKARENLGLQFKLAVRDHDWVSAVRVGERIMREFPNTRMAAEVRDRIDLLRTRMAQQGGASGSWQTTPEAGGDIGALGASVHEAKRDAGS